MQTAQNEPNHRDAKAIASEGQIAKGYQRHPATVVNIKGEMK